MNECRAVFLDRDGTLIKDTGYLADATLVELLPNVPAGLAQLREYGFLLLLASNQSGVGRGFFMEEQLGQVDRRLAELLAGHALALDASYYCIHAPQDACACRKPRPGLLLRAAREWNIDLARSFMIGDKPSDMAAGRKAGCTTIWLAPSDTTARTAADWVAGDLLEAARWIETQLYLKGREERGSL